jgi:hypothetical protein
METWVMMEEAVRTAFSGSNTKPVSKAARASSSLPIPCNAVAFLLRERKSVAMSLVSDDYRLGRCDKPEMCLWVSRVQLDTRLGISICCRPNSHI